MRGDARRRQYRHDADSGEKWRTSGAKRKRDPGGPRELAAALAERPGAYDARERSIRAVRARIGWIRASRLHGQYLNVRTLILSGNRISDLAWVRHFSQLQVLSLEANCVQDTRELRYLRHAPSLQRIRLEENPVVRSPFYAAHVKMSAKNLIELDCAPALDEATARKEVHLDLSLQSSLVEDFCELITLEQAEKLCRVHAELAMCTVRYPSWSTEREGKRLLRLKHGWQFRELARETVADGTVEHLTSGNLGIFLRVCRYQDRLDAHAISDLQAEIAQWAVHSTPAKMSRRCNRSSSRRAETRWEVHAYNAVASDLREAIARVVLMMDRGRELDQEWLDTRPRLGPATATRHAAELEAERALLRRAELERAHHDVAWIRETIKKRATPRPPPPSIRTRPETPPYCRSPVPSPAMSAGASIASWRSADKSHFDELESCSESLYLASEHLLQATPRALEQL